MPKLFLGLRVLLGLVFAAAAVTKIAGIPMMVQEFDAIGLGQWFRYVTAACETGAALLLIQPRTVSVGAGILVCVCIGALIAQLRILHGDIVHCIVLGALAAWTGWQYRNTGGGAIA